MDLEACESINVDLGGFAWLYVAFCRDLRDLWAPSSAACGGTKQKAVDRIPCHAWSWGRWLADCQNGGWLAGWLAGWLDGIW